MSSRARSGEQGSKGDQRVASSARPSAGSVLLHERRTLDGPAKEEAMRAMGLLGEGGLATVRESA